MPPGRLQKLATEDRPLDELVEVEGGTICGVLFLVAGLAVGQAVLDGQAQAAAALRGHDNAAMSLRAEQARRHAELKAQAPPPLPPPPSPSPPSPSPKPPPPPPPPQPLELIIPPYVGADNVPHAEQLCAQQGGFLASIKSATQNDQVLAMIVKYNRDRATIGLIMNDATYKWTWKDGTTAAAYNHWAQGMPDNPYQEKCSEMWTTGEWNDVPCDGGPRAYVCEVAVPPPTFTFPCSAGVKRANAHAVTCRYEVTSLSAAQKQTITWPVAKARCALLGHGARLAEPRTPEQVQFLASILRSHAAESLWIGLKKVTATTFKWDSGALLTADEARWAATEPNGNPGDCVEMWEDGTWNDRACDIGKVLACERPL